MEFSLEQETKKTTKKIEKAVEEGKEPSLMRIARPVFRDLNEYSSKDILHTDNPRELRDLIFGFYQEHSNHRKINDRSLSPVKKMLDRMIEDKGATKEIRRDLKMVRDTVTVENIKEEDKDKELTIFTPKEQSRILEHADNDEKFIIRLFLETGAKIGAISALKEEDYKREENKIVIKRQHVQDSGDEELSNIRKREIYLPAELGNSFQELIDNNETEYLFGETSKDARKNLGDLMKRLSEETGLDLRSETLRNTAAYNKMKSGVPRKRIKEKYLGMKSDWKLEKIYKKANVN